MHIRSYEPGDEDAVVALWEACDLMRPWNDPRKDIARKLADSPALLLVGEEDGQVIGSVMVGYDGHRGWINYLAVLPPRRGAGLGRALMDAAEGRLMALGCAKVNLQVRGDNEAASAFYEAVGYQRQELIDFGKRLISDE